ncbi:MAG TPA: type II toxin-antitoxin system HicB family antitoxin [Alphaproteobacteria bacterium]|nr:type II toxin-antitoxin system HicB family antitoxin [Alphaproteobacteria bacterium]
MKDMMEYKGYYGSAHYSDDDKVFYGKVEYIRSLVTYEGIDVHSLQKAFKDSVEDYLESCKERKVVPEKPFKGTFNVRLSSELHRKAALTAYERHINLNTIVSEALESYLQDSPPPHG